MGTQISYGPYTAEVDSHGYFVFMTHTHHLIHDGKLFIASDVQTTAASAAYLIKTISRSAMGSAEPHLFININTDKALRVDFCEAPTQSASGTALTWVNVNRWKSATSPGASTKVYRGPTYSADGTRLYTEKIGGAGATPIGRVPEKGRQNAEWVLNYNTYYLLKIVSDAADTTYSVEFELYEDKERANK